MVVGESNSMNNTNTSPRTEARRGPQSARSVATPRTAAFTMIEMLVVLMIMGIILAIGAGVASRVVSTADEKDTISRLKLVQGALEIYFEEEGKWPGNLGDMLLVERCRGQLDNIAEDSRSGTGASFKVKDAYGADIKYASSGGLGGGPKLYSAGPDGTFGNDDDIYAAAE